MLFLLVVPKENRNRRAWLILIPIGLILGILHLPAISVLMDVESAEMLRFLIVTGASAWGMVWLAGHWFQKFGRFAAFCLVFGLMFAIGLLSSLCQFQEANDIAPLMFIYGLGVFELFLAMMIAGYSCRGKYTPPRLLGYLLLWMGVIAVILPGILVLFIENKLDAAMIVIPMSLICGGVIYLLNLPFMILAFNSPFYRKRLEQIFIKNTDQRLKNEWYRFLNRDLQSAAPTCKTIAVQDLVGRWQFYLDGLSKTVGIDFRPDGTFAQIIFSNQGVIQQCPGGTWRLEGSEVYLTGYITSAGGASLARTWRMIDTPSGGLALLGGDESDSRPFFIMRCPG